MSNLDSKNEENQNNNYVIQVAKEFKKEDLASTAMPFELSHVEECNSHFYVHLKFKEDEEKSKIVKWLNQQDAILNALAQECENVMVVPNQVKMLILVEEVENFIKAFKVNFKLFSLVNFDMLRGNCKYHYLLNEVIIRFSSNVSLQKLLNQMDSLVENPAHGILEVSQVNLWTGCSKRALSDSVNELLERRQKLNQERLEDAGLANQHISS